MTALNVAEDAIMQLESLQTIYASKQAYDLAESYYEAGDYEAAMDAYQEVDESDTERYEDAQSKIASATENYRAQIIEKVGSPSTVDEYETAISLLNSALAVLPDDEELTELLEACKTELVETIKSTALSEATDAIAAGDYEEAFDLLEAALKYAPEDSDLQALVSSAQSQYEEYIASLVADLVAQDDYDGALELIQQALKVLPGSTALKELQTTTQEQKPVPLTDLVVIASDNIEVITTAITDRWGNYYDGTVKFDASRDAYALYNLNKNYTTFTATVFVPSEATNGKDMFISIYVDDELVYYVDSITEESAPISLSVDVSNASTLRIVTGNDGSYNSGYLCFSDAILKK
ncbi:MAG: NPCBM/NEW2 domain-containing protein [Clostridiales bacterium]|nr:NPCBM/NEW2 domain-containing protein [Clostridiales bacterium]